MGFDGVWSFETCRDPFLPLLQVALASRRLSFGPNIAVAFARSPFSMAMTAWDLHRESGGRLILGLGTQVRAHVERRFSMPFDRPAARITDYVRCMRAIWETFQTGARPDYEGPFYRFQLINDFFNPGPIDQPPIPVYIAGVNPRMAKAAGAVADGFCVHVMHSPAYLREIIRPAIEEGARTGGRSAGDITLSAMLFVVRGDTPARRAESEKALRRQIAFYASTPSYRGFLEYHGHGATGERLSALMRQRKLEEMPALIGDDLLAAVAVSEADGDIAEQIRTRYDDHLVQRVCLYEPVPADADIEQWRQFTMRVKEW